MLCVAEWVKGVPSRHPQGATREPIVGASAVLQPRGGTHVPHELIFTSK